MRVLLLTFLGCSLAACTASEDPDLEDRPQLLIDCAALPVCASPASVQRTFESGADVEARVTAAWVSCEAPPQFHEDWVGLELRGTKHFSILVPDGNGHCVRGTGPSYEGKWWVEDVSEQNPEGTYQISMVWNDGATTGHIPVLATGWMHDSGPVGGTWIAK